MPLTRIDATDTIGPDRLGALADALHQAMVETSASRLTTGIRS